MRLEKLFSISDAVPPYAFRLLEKVNLAATKHGLHYDTAWYETKDNRVNCEVLFVNKGIVLIAQIEIGFGANTVCLWVETRKKGASRKRQKSKDILLADPTIEAIKLAVSDLLKEVKP